MYPIIIKLGFSGILHSTMVERFCKTFKCGRVDLLSRQRKHCFVNKNECPLTHATNFLLWPVWQNAKCYCVVNTHCSLLKQLYLATSYTQQILVQQKLNCLRPRPSCYAFRLRWPRGLISLGTRQSNNLAGWPCGALGKATRRMC